MKILILFIHKNRIWKTMRSNKMNYMKRQMMILSLKKNWNLLTQTLITIFHLHQQTQVMCQFIKIIHKTSLIIQRILANASSESLMDTRAKHFIQIPSKLPLHNWMEYQTPFCSPTSKYFLTPYLYNVLYKLSMAENPLQNVLGLSS